MCHQIPLNSRKHRLMDSAEVQAHYTPLHTAVYTPSVSPSVYTPAYQVHIPLHHQPHHCCAENRSTTQTERGENIWAHRNWAVEDWEKTFFLHLFGFGEPVSIPDSDSCSWVTGFEPDVVFCCCSPFTPCFNMLCILGSFSAHLGCKEC